MVTTTVKHSIFANLFFDYQIFTRPDRFKTGNQPVHSERFKSNISDRMIHQNKISQFIDLIDG